MTSNTNNPNGNNPKNGGGKRKSGNEGNKSKGGKKTPGPVENKNQLPEFKMKENKTNSKGNVLNIEQSSRTLTCALVSILMEFVM